MSVDRLQNQLDCRAKPDDEWIWWDKVRIKRYREKYRTVVGGDRGKDNVIRGKSGGNAKLMMDGVPVWEK